jgi:RNA polymerase sigma-70 factor (ECF subfamily)
MRPDEELVASAYEQYGHLVLRRCRYILRDQHQAEDALQEVFVRVLRYGESLAHAEKPVRWLYRVAERVCFDMMRRKRPKTVSGILEFQPAPAAGNPAAAASDREVLLKFLDRFDKKTRRLILLYHLDGLTQDRIAAETGWSRQTVNRKLAAIQQRARALRRKLGVA